MGFLVRILINSLAIFFVAAIVPGMEIRGFLAALGGGLVLGLVNAVVRPILLLLTLPLTFLTLGIFLFVLNGICLQLVSYLVQGFDVFGLWAAIYGAFLISIVSWLLNSFVSDQGKFVPLRRPEKK